MAYYEGVGVTTGLAYMSAFKTAFTAAPAAGWSFVETWTESSVTWDVYKCSAASSGLPQDFHVVLSDAQAGSSTLAFMVCEGYDTTAHRMIRPALTQTTSMTPPAGADGAVGDSASLYRPAGTAATCTRTAGTGLNTASAHLTMTLSSSVAWNVFVVNNAIVFSESGSRWIYLGGFTSFVKDAATNDPMPILMHGPALTNAANHSISAFTRSAMNAGIPGDHRASVNAWHGGILNNSTTSNVASSSTFDKYSATSGPYMLPSYLTRSSNDGANASTLGIVRGRLPHMLFNPGGGAGWGDTITVGSDTYQAVNSASWMKKVL